MHDMTVADLPLAEKDIRRNGEEIAPPPRVVLLDDLPLPAVEDLTERRLVIDTPYESAGKRSLFFLLAIGLTILHLNFSHTYWGPGHYGNNQNAYLAGGKFLALHGTSGFEPKTPWEFVGWMWNMADEASTSPGGGWYYPKYPLGLPMLNAVVYKIGHWVGGAETAVDWTFKVSPVCTAAAMFAIFLITRLVAGSFAGILAMVSFATLTVVLVLMNNPYSHAADMGFVCCGMYALIKWWQRGGWWRGAIAGFLLGYAATIRYTEGLLVLPIIAAVVGSMRWHRPIGWVVAFGISGLALICAMIANAVKPSGATAIIIASLIAAPIPIIVILIRMIADGHLRMLTRLAVPLLAWAFPLGVLVIFNLVTVGSPTGYDSTNESTGFTLEELQRKWRWGIDQFYNTGLYMILPLSFCGMLMAFRWNWRVGLLLVLWYVPGTVLYLTYYWGMNLPVWGFLRFFASVLPAGVIAAVWLLQRAASSMETPVLPMPRRQVLVTAISVLLAVAGAWAIGYFLIDRNWAGARFGGYVAMCAIAGALIAAGIAGAGRGVASAIAMGTIVAFPAAINLDVSDGPLERDHTIATNMANAGRNIRRAAPAGSVVFANSQKVCNYIQFAGDYELYGSDYILGGRPVPGIRGGPDGENPNPIQPARSKFTAKVYEKYGKEQRVAEARRIVTEALQSGRRVFVVNEVTSSGALNDQLTGDKTLSATVVSSWTDPVKMSSAAMSSLSTIGGDGIARREPWRWKVVEIKLAPPGTTQPATNPTTAPATQVVSNNE